MPGSSLWLVPPDDSALYRTCHRLITHQIPSLFFPGAVPPPPLFTPHVTLTADTVPSDLLLEPKEQGRKQGQERRQSPSSTSPTHPAKSAQTWLDGLVLPPPTRELRVAIQKVQVEGHFFRKLTMQCEKSSQLCELAGTCRAARGVEGLLDGGEQEDVGKWVRECYRPHLSLMYSDLPEDEVQIKLDEVNSEISQAKQANPESLTARGGEIWLVPTYKPIEEWQPIAKREIPYGVQWEWQT
ncbi:hypothetical protein D0865_12943 [Hortaea werneckii]|uniref:2',3'-cyclic-nucleotide 3'-phosphodiesterase n=1 Tax=Hortaea werneckii TaxID=91943 RepID=A0A3M7BGU4_HORWE|nr:hypothetical protein D0865_12943 [Hortaea werneckii]